MAIEEIKWDIQRLLETAVSDIERWKGHAYQEDDEVGLAVETIKEVIERLKTEK